MTRIEVHIDRLVLRGVPGELAEGIAPLVAAAAERARDRRPPRRRLRRADGAGAARAPRTDREALAERVARDVWASASRTCRGDAAMSRTAATPLRGTDAAPPRRISHRHDASERQADRAADIVARGGSVTGWSFANMPAEASVHRDEDEKKKPPPETLAKLEDKPKSESESYAEAGGKVVEGVLKTKVGGEVQDRITSSKPLTGAIGVGMLAAGKEVPIPLGKGVTLGVKIDGLTEGKVNSAGVTLSFGGGTSKKTTAKPVIDRDSEKLMESIRSQSEGKGQQTPGIRPLWVPKSVPQLPPPTPGGPGWKFESARPRSVDPGRAADATASPARGDQEGGRGQARSGHDL